MASDGGDTNSSNTTEETGEFPECGLCYENDDLKRLPCSPAHIFCVTCLTKDSEQTKVILCPVCKRVFEDSIVDIPSATAPIDEFNCCDVCKRKDEKFKYAQMYCVVCAKKLCDSHLKSHNDALDDHRRIPMVEYQKEYRKLETRYCVTHTRYKYGMGCEKCYRVFCAECVAEAGSCKNDAGHTIVPLDKLAMALIEKINDKKVWVFDTEESLLEIEKSLSEKISEFDCKTKEMVEQLHQARDKQTDDTRRQYKELEEKLLELRIQSKTKLIGLLEDEVGKKLNKLTRQLLKINSRVYSHHEVDVVKGFGDTEKLVDELISMKIENCSLPVVDIKIAPSESVAGIPVEIVQTEENLQVPSELNVQRIGPPKSMKLLSTVTILRGAPISICHHNGVTYVGTNGYTVSRISGDGVVQQEFIRLFGRQYIHSVKTFKDELYVAACSSNLTKHQIKVYNTEGKLQRSWNCHGCNGYSFKFVWCGDKMITPDCENGRLVTYSHTGQFLTSTKISEPTDPPVTIASSGMDAVVVANYTHGRVFKVEIDTGKVLWTSTHVCRPRGIACHNHHVYVGCDDSSTKVHILDSETGNSVGELTGENHDTHKQASQIYHMTVTEDQQLIVTQNANNSIEYYQLNY